MTFLHDVWAAFGSHPRRLSPKYLYDEEGSRLFEKICETPEYYPTRTEIELLERVDSQLHQAGYAIRSVIEPGSGAGAKTLLLFHALPNVETYVPIEISPKALDASVRRMADVFPSVHSIPISGDFTGRLRVPYSVRGPRLVFFPGSTLGNFEPEDARRLLEEFSRLAGSEGRLLIGIDLVKPRDILEAAYNDGQGVTADFNLNLLHRINRELGGDIDPSTFEHVAHWDERLSRVEMHLRSKRVQKVVISSREFIFDRGETLQTESSYKYTQESFESLAQSAALQVEKFWTDDRGWFGLAWLRPAA